jgi:hypothetical protein
MTFVDYAVASPGPNGWHQVKERGVTIWRNTPVSVDERELEPRVVLRNGAEVDILKDVLVLGPLGSRADYLTVTWRPKPQITTGCFTGTIEQFEYRVNQMPRDSLTYLEYSSALLLIKTFAIRRETGSLPVELDDEPIPWERS